MAFAPLVDSVTGRSSKWLATNSAAHVVIDGFIASQYETVAASQTTQTLGATGAIGDYLDHVTVFPASTSPGVVTILDGTTPWGGFAGGVSSVANLIPFSIPVGATSKNGAWIITTGANVSCTGVGTFT